MKLGLLAGNFGPRMRVNLDVVKHAENLGFDSVWTAEAWGSDAVTPATWMLAHTTKIKVGTAIMQMPARSPAMTAMTAMSLAAMSDGRFIVGLGASGPGRRRLARCALRQAGDPAERSMSDHETNLPPRSTSEFEGELYQLPYTGTGATGYSKPLKSILHCERDSNFLRQHYTQRCCCRSGGCVMASFNLDGSKHEVFDQPIREGFAAAGDKNKTQFEVSPFVTVSMGDDVEHVHDAYSGQHGPLHRRYGGKG
ncbi:MAG: hypothetical protein CM15mP120_01330 [Pseudomonadota bacterium]|nr:MAG: hypothetical protein CM15mP120_01330 [Pseudomonadota bacterium]